MNFPKFDKSRIFRLLLFFGWLALLLILWLPEEEKTRPSRLRLDGHEVEVYYDSSHRNGFSGGSYDDGTSTFAYLESDGLTEILLIDDELFIDGWSYGLIEEEYATISIDYRVEGANDDDPEVKVNGVRVRGDMTAEHRYHLANWRVVEKVGPYTVRMQRPVRANNSERYYRVSGDHLWTPEHEARFVDGELYHDGKNYGPVEPGDIIDIDDYSVLVNSLKRLPKDQSK